MTMLFGTFLEHSEDMFDSFSMFSLHGGSIFCWHDSDIPLLTTPKESLITDLCTSIQVKKISKKPLNENMIFQVCCRLLQRI